jgi:hypothetical protein
MLFLLSPAAPLTLPPFVSALFSPFLSVSEVTATLSELITPVNSSGLRKLNIMQKEEEQNERQKDNNGEVEVERMIEAQCNSMCSLV